VSAFYSVALVIGIFFLMGIGVGVVTVIAMAETRRSREIHRDDSAGDGRAGQVDWRGPPDTGAEEFDDNEDTGDNNRPQWPDSGYGT
jgi:hypothetical protein